MTFDSCVGNVTGEQCVIQNAGYIQPIGIHLEILRLDLMVSGLLVMCVIS